MSNNLQLFANSGQMELCFFLSKLKDEGMFLSSDDRVTRLQPGESNLMNMVTLRDAWILRLACAAFHCCLLTWLTGCWHQSSVTANLIEHPSRKLQASIKTHTEVELKRAKPNLGPESTARQAWEIATIPSTWVVTKTTACPSAVRMTLNKVGNKHHLPHCTTIRRSGEGFPERRTRLLQKTVLFCDLILHHQCRTCLEA